MENQDYYIAKAIEVSKKSPDTNRKVGAVIVRRGKIICDGYNDYPEGVSLDGDKDKQIWTVHAEIAAIAEAARMGIKTIQTTMYTTYFPCADCAKAIINAGIMILYTPKPDFNHHRWGESWRTARQMFNEAWVFVSYYDSGLID